MTLFILQILNGLLSTRGGSRTAATSKMECFLIIVDGWKPLTIITKHPILDVAAVLDPPLTTFSCLEAVLIISSRVWKVEKLFHFGWINFFLDHALSRYAVTQCYFIFIHLHLL